MTASSQITDYISKGTHAARPVSPNVPSGCSAIYFETDTANTFIWTGSAWVQLNGGGSTSLTIVQNATAAANGSAITSVTMGAAPTNGNLLVAFVMGISGSSAGAWTLLATDSAGTTFSQIYWKVAGAGESATQQPIPGGNTTTAITIYEISGGAAPTASWAFQDATATTHSVNPEAFAASGLFLGAVHSESTTTLPSSYSAGITADSSAVGAGLAQQGFHFPVSSAGTGTTLTATYAASTNARIAALFLK